MHVALLNDITISPESSEEPSGLNSETDILHSNAFKTLAKPYNPKNPQPLNRKLLNSKPPKPLKPKPSKTRLRASACGSSAMQNPKGPRYSYGGYFPKSY